MHFTGLLRKMQTEYHSPVQYYLDLGNDFIHVNQLLNKTVNLRHTGYECLHCHLDRPIFRMGYCKSCFFEVPQANESIIRPELSRAHLGEEQRDLEWEKSFELQPHIVYLAVTSGLKVGVTRKTQIPTRWIDQGAHQALVLAETENRYEAGRIEVELAKHVADKTSFRKMLRNDFPPIDLTVEKQRLAEFFPKEFQKFISNDSSVWDLIYPYENIPEKVKSTKLEPNGTLNGKLVGIKGQYWIFADDSVWNVRSHEGFTCELSIL